MRDVIHDLSPRQEAPELSIWTQVGDTTARGVQVGSAGLSALITWASGLLTLLFWVVAALVLLDLALGMFRAWRERSPANPFRASRACGDTLAKCLIYGVGYVAVGLVGLAGMELSQVITGVDLAPAVELALAATLGLYAGTEGLSIARHLQALNSPIHAMLEALSGLVHRTARQASPDQDKDQDP